jgi:hypothetical protein
VRAGTPGRPGKRIVSSDPVPKPTPPSARPVARAWPGAGFAMIHARTREAPRRKDCFIPDAASKPTTPRQRLTRRRRRGEFPTGLRACAKGRNGFFLRGSAREVPPPLARLRRDAACTMAFAQPYACARERRGGQEKGLFLAVLFRSLPHPPPDCDAMLQSLALTKLLDLRSAIDSHQTE